MIKSVVKIIARKRTFICLDDNMFTSPYSVQEWEQTGSFQLNLVLKVRGHSQTTFTNRELTNNNYPPIFDTQYFSYRRCAEQNYFSHFAMRYPLKQCGWIILHVNIRSGPRNGIYNHKNCSPRHLMTFLGLRDLRETFEYSPLCITTYIQGIFIYLRILFYVT